MRQVADIARLFDVKSGTVKKWCHEFGEHLSPSAVVKGKTRKFNDSDLRVFALVYYYWEDDPDYEHIHACLNSRGHEEEEIVEFSFLHSSIFRDADECEYIGDEAWKCGILFADDSPIFSQLAVARSYKTAADALVEALRDSHEPTALAYPIFFTYRHALELYLKVIGRYDPKAGKKMKHSLAMLMDLIEEKYGDKFPTWMRERLSEIHNIDPGSTSFRYFEGTTGAISGRNEIWVDLGHLRFVMDKLCDIFDRVIGKMTNQP